ncbi:unnamed protein product [Bursaphelenchus okinawaensis]|uniref:Uncharacterized protein n=1 Tax=Bursaphelenchus okinawaensis TaxID=465554 RepID=A0A811KP12_9BILA|nr:unnamed protein product [Bursaphelenchus okinawaensis]CAG9107657.1 unnamed protein product [Bursaphelenchus okinawaensis]
MDPHGNQFIPNNFQGSLANQLNQLGGGQNVNLVHTLSQLNDLKNSNGNQPQFNQNLINSNYLQQDINNYGGNTNGWGQPQGNDWDSAKMAAMYNIIQNSVNHRPSQYPNANFFAQNPSLFNNSVPSVPNSDLSAFSSSSSTSLTPNMPFNTIDNGYNNYFQSLPSSSTKMPLTSQMETDALSEFLDIRPGNFFNNQPDDFSAGSQNQLNHGVGGLESNLNGLRTLNDNLNATQQNTSMLNISQAGNLQQNSAFGSQYNPTTSCYGQQNALDNVLNPRLSGHSNQQGLIPPDLAGLSTTQIGTSRVMNNMNATQNLMTYQQGLANTLSNPNQTQLGNQVYYPTVPTINQVYSKAEIDLDSVDLNELAEKLSKYEQNTKPVTSGVDKGYYGFPGTSTNIPGSSQKTDWSNIIPGSLQGPSNHLQEDFQRSTAAKTSNFKALQQEMGPQSVPIALSRTGNGFSQSPGSSIPYNGPQSNKSYHGPASNASFHGGSQMSHQGPGSTSSFHGPASQISQHGPEGQASLHNPASQSSVHGPMSHSSFHGPPSNMSGLAMSTHMFSPPAQPSHLQSREVPSGSSQSNAVSGFDDVQQGVAKCTENNQRIDSLQGFGGHPGILQNFEATTHLDPSQTPAASNILDTSKNSNIDTSGDTDKMLDIATELAFGLPSEAPREPKEKTENGLHLQEFSEPSRLHKESEAADQLGKDSTTFTEFNKNSVSSTKLNKGSITPTELEKPSDSSTGNQECSESPKKPTDSLAFEAMGSESPKNLKTSEPTEENKALKPSLPSETTLSKETAAAVDHNKKEEQVEEKEKEDEADKNAKLIDFFNGMASSFKVEFPKLATESLSLDTVEFTPPDSPTESASANPSSLLFSTIPSNTTSTNLSMFSTFKPFDFNLPQQGNQGLVDSPSSSKLISFLPDTKLEKDDKLLLAKALDKPKEEKAEGSKKVPIYKLDLNDQKEDKKKDSKNVYDFDEDEFAIPSEPVQKKPEPKPIPKISIPQPVYHPVKPKHHHHHKNKHVKIKIKPIEAVPDQKTCLQVVKKQFEANSEAGIRVFPLHDTDIQVNPTPKAWRWDSDPNENTKLEVVVKEEVESERPSLKLTIKMTKKEPASYYEEPENVDSYGNFGHSKKRRKVSDSEDDEDEYLPSAVKKSKKKKKRRASVKEFEALEEFDRLSQCSSTEAHPISTRRNSIIDPFKHANDLDDETKLKYLALEKTDNLTKGDFVVDKYDLLNLDIEDVCIWRVEKQVKLRFEPCQTEDMYGFYNMTDHYAVWYDEMMSNCIKINCEYISQTKNEAIIRPLYPIDQLFSAIPIDSDDLQIVCNDVDMEKEVGKGRGRDSEEVMEQDSGKNVSRILDSESIQDSEDTVNGKLDSEGLIDKNMDSEGLVGKNMDSEGTTLKDMCSKGILKSTKDSEELLCNKTSSEGVMKATEDSEGVMMITKDSEGFTKTADSEGFATKTSDLEAFMKKTEDSGGNTKKKEYTEGLTVKLRHSDGTMNKTGDSEGITRTIENSEGLMGKNRDSEEIKQNITPSESIKKKLSASEGRMKKNLNLERILKKIGPESTMKNTNSPGVKAKETPNSEGFVLQGLVAKETVNAGYTSEADVATEKDVQGDGIALKINGVYKVIPNKSHDENRGESNGQSTVNGLKNAVCQLQDSEGHREDSGKTIHGQLDSRGHFEEREDNARQIQVSEGYSKDSDRTLHGLLDSEGHREGSSKPLLGLLDSEGNREDSDKLFNSKQDSEGYCDHKNEVHSLPRCNKKSEGNIDKDLQILLDSEVHRRKASTSATDSHVNCNSETHGEMLRQEATDTHDNCDSKAHREISKHQATDSHGKFDSEAQRQMSKQQTADSLLFCDSEAQNDKLKQQTTDFHGKHDSEALPVETLKSLKSTVLLLIKEVVYPGSIHKIQNDNSTPLLHGLHTVIGMIEDVYCNILENFEILQNLKEKIDSFNKMVKIHGNYGRNANYGSFCENCESDSEVILYNLFNLLSSLTTVMDNVNTRVDEEIDHDEFSEKPSVSPLLLCTNCEGSISKLHNVKHCLDHLFDEIRQEFIGMCINSPVKKQTTAYDKFCGNKDFIDKMATKYAKILSQDVDNA